MTGNKIQEFFDEITGNGIDYEEIPETIHEVHVRNYTKHKLEITHTTDPIEGKKGVLVTFHIRDEANAK